MKAVFVVAGGQRRERPTAIREGVIARNRRRPERRARLSALSVAIDGLGMPVPRAPPRRDDGSIQPRFGVPENLRVRRLVHADMVEDERRGEVVLARCLPAECSADGEGRQDEERMVEHPDRTGLRRRHPDQRAASDRPALPARPDAGARRSTRGRSRRPPSARHRRGEPVPSPAPPRRDPPYLRRREHAPATFIEPAADMQPAISNGVFVDHADDIRRFGKIRNPDRPGQSVAEPTCEIGYCSSRP